MPEFWYSALTGKGAVEEGWITAPSEIVVEEQLRRQGSFLIKAESRERARELTDGKVDRRELVAFLEYLSGSLGAGIPLLTTLDDVSRRFRSSRLRVIVAEVRHAIADEGQSLSEAFAQHPRAFPALCVSTIRAGEASGQLAFALQELVDSMEWQENISSWVRQATWYPLAMLAALSLFVTGLVGLVFPRMVPILEQRHVDLPLATRVVVSAWLFAQHHATVFLAALVLVVGAGLLLRRTPRARFWIDGMALKIPMIGQFILEVNMARVATYLGLFYKTGVDLVQSLVLVERLTTNSVVAGVVRDARERIAGGETIVAAFGRSPLVPLVVMRSLALGERTGRLDEALDRTKLYYEREIPSGVRRGITLVQPAMIVVLGAVILVVVLAMVLPVLNIFSATGIQR